MSLMVFPAAFMANTFAMMLVMIGLSVFGKPELAADFGLIHGATVAMFYSFSGNARSLILGESGKISAAQILRLRFFMVLPLAAVAFILSIGVVAIGWVFASLLVLRRAAEWLAEIFLSEQEIHHRKRPAIVFCATQGVFSVLLLLALIDGGIEVLPITLVWAISPLFSCIDAQLVKNAATRNTQLFRALKLLLPHFGSTAIIGVSVYVFRLFILLIAGKQVAGDLFATFAIGGILGAVFAQALGPTMVRRANNLGGGRFGRLFSITMFGSAGLGVALLITAAMAPAWLEWTQKSTLFWLAAGCSLLGGLVMVLAQRIRLEIVQSRAGGDVFGSDMLANILLISSIPFFYYGAGPASLAALYLFGAVLSLGFYMSECEGLLGRVDMFKTHERWVLLALAAVLFTPLFFQLSGGLYRTEFMYSSAGTLALLPIPICVFACYGGMVLLGRYSEARLSLATLFFVFMCMLLTTALVVAGEGGYQGAKLILLVQFMLPMFALVLGQQFGIRAGAINVIANVVLLLLLVIVPLQLLATVIKGANVLSSSVFIFNVYQHMQYVSVIFVALFLIALFVLFDSAKHRPWFLLLALLIGVYVALSTAMLGMALLVAGTLGFSVRSVLLKRDAKVAILLFFIVFGSTVLGFLYILKSEFIRGKFGIVDIGIVDAGIVDNGIVDAGIVHNGIVDNGFGTGMGSDTNSGSTSLQRPGNLVERMVYWRFYGNGVMESWRTFLLGHMQAPDRTLYPSAHNYYLDLVYNFGFIALLPLLGLIGFTIFTILRQFSALWYGSYEIGLAGVVVFLLLVDNAFKVGMRQPYPGVVTFFLWGVLLAVLLRHRQTEVPGKVA